MTSLRNYAKEYHLDIPENALHSEVADIVSKCVLVERFDSVDTL